MPTAQRRRFIFRATTAYAIGGSIWIFFSDYLVSQIVNVRAAPWLSAAKGFVFILVTSMLLNMALRSVPEIGQTPRDRPKAKTTRQAMAYAIGVVASAATVVVRFKLTQVYGDSSQLVLLVPPIVFAAFLGGLGPGLAATVVVTLGALLTFEPVGQFWIAHEFDYMRLMVLFVTGVIISLLSAQLHREFHRAEADQARLVEATAQIRDSEARLRLALHSSRAGIWEADLGSNRHIWSDELWPLLGLIPGSCDPGFECWLGTVDARDRESIRTTITAARAVGEEFYLEWRVATAPDEPERWLMSRGMRLENSARDGPRYIGVTLDISERKRAERQVQQLNEDLELRVAERTTALRAANDELESFAFAVSHDLRTPLRSLLGMSQALAEDLGDTLPEGPKRYLVEIQRAGIRMSGLIGGLLALSRDTLHTLRHDSVDLSATAAEQLQDMARGEPDRRVSVDIQPGIVTVGDSRLLASVVQNLVGNAWKYTARVPEARIRAHAQRLNGSDWFCVSDNGPGFDAAQASTLFRPFQRLHDESEFPGIGIGLATVRRIVQRHGGRVEAEGRPGQGATFRFTLPGLTLRTAATGRGTP
jgi:PAS domain S-box-containing protein